MNTCIARVVVDIALDREFDYLVPEGMRGQVFVGSRVSVPFGRSRKSGYVVGLADRSERTDLKPITSVTGRVPLLSDGILRLARWIGDYYCAPIEHAVRTVLPGAVRRQGGGFKERLHVTCVNGPDSPGAFAKRMSSAQSAVMELLRAQEGGMQLSEVLDRTGVSASAVKTLERKGLVRIGRAEVGRNPLDGRTVVPTEPRNPTQAQAAALELIRKSVDTLEPRVVLLHGVTGSGKTEVYLQAIAHALSMGMGAIVLVPEISLTPQTVERFSGRFGSSVAVLHSHLSEGERHDEWHRIREGGARIVIGARSAVFAPVVKPGLIVVDEEHDTSYKQDESPRYNARDVAVMRGLMENCAVLLGSATPAMESYRNALAGKYGMAVLPERVDDRKMPSVEIVDMRIDAGAGGRGRVLSRALVDAIRLRLDRAEQTILFLNRRGYSTSMICQKCGCVAECKLCSIPFTYHRVPGELRCHVCGSCRRVPETCPQCGDPGFKFSGIGTQRVENIVSSLFPGARVRRMDSDATRRRNSHGEILDDFRTGKIDILVGTQMIAKGLDFPNVTLIGVVHADLSLHVPDFRAGERTFQLLTQVAGRAGRGDVPGEVIVQTYTPQSPAVQLAARMDYRGFYDQECRARMELGYPPFLHLVCITAKGPSDERVVSGIQALARELTAALPGNVAIRGPAPAPRAMAKGHFRHQIVLKSGAIKATVARLREVLKGFKWPPKVTCSVDVDAISLC